MEEQFVTILSLVLMTFTSFLTVESLFTKRVRVRGHREGHFSIRPDAWFHFVSRSDSPGPYWFWTIFYIAGFFLGAYFFVVL